MLQIHNQLCSIGMGIVHAYCLHVCEPTQVQTALRANFLV